MFAGNYNWLRFRSSPAALTIASTYLFLVRNPGKAFSHNQFRPFGLHLAQSQLCFSHVM